MGRAINVPLHHYFATLLHCSKKLTCKHLSFLLQPPPQISRYDLSLLHVWPPARKSVTRAQTFFHVVMQRLHILFLAAPLGLLTVAVRYGSTVLNDGYVQIPIDYTLLPPMATFSAFIMGTVLNNVMSDYKESEKIPAEVLGYFHGLLMFARVEASTHGYDVKPMLREVEAMLLCFMAHLDHRDTDFSEAVKGFNNAYLEYCRIAAREAHRVGAHVEFEGPQHMVVELQKKWGRVNDISRTSILLPGYTLIDLLCMLMLATLISVSWKTVDYRISGTTTGYWACGIFSTIIIYLAILVRFLDDPFEWPSGFHFKTYVNGAPISLSIRDEIFYVCGIDFEPVFADFGSELRELLYKPSTPKHVSEY